MQMHQSDITTHSTSVALTNCGNFVCIGSKGGAVYKYNIQSGLIRGAYPKSSSTPTVKKGNVDIRKKIPGNVFHDAEAIGGM